MFRLTGATVVLAMLAASPAAMAQQPAAVQPWVQAGLGATSSRFNDPVAGPRREGGGPVVSLAGGLLIQSRYVFGVQKTTWQGMSLEWGEGGSSTVGFAGLVASDVNMPVFVRVSAGRSGYWYESNGLHRYSGTVLGGGRGVVAFPRWAISPTVSVDGLWWISGQNVGASSGAGRVSSRQLSASLGLVLHCC